MWARATALSALAGAAYVAYEAACPRAQRWGKGFHLGLAGKRRLALSFDDGPSEWTPAVLEVLAEHEATATFFFCGRNVERLPRVARAVLEAGHEVGNHTYSHPFLLTCSAGEIREELRRAQAALWNESGARARLFRPPYGCRAPALRRALPDLGLTTVMWSVIGMDWKWPSERIMRRLLAGTRDGAVVCLHDGRETETTVDRRHTVAALRTVLPVWKQWGYRFVTCGEMAEEIFAPDIMDVSTPSANGTRAAAS